MNRYGRMAYEHSRRYRPKAFASLTDPAEFFTGMGEDLASQITQLRDQLLGKRRPKEDLESYRRRSYQALRQAEELVLTDAVFQEQEEGPAVGSEDAEILAYRVQLATISKAMAAVDETWHDTPAEAPSTP